MSRRTLIRLALALLLMSGSLAGLGWWLVGTAEGARWALTLAASRVAPAQHIALERLRGSLLAGVTIEGLTVSSLPAPFQNSHLRIERLSSSAYPLWALRDLTLTASELRVEQLPWLPPETVVEIQEVEAGWPLGLAGLRSVRNGRLKLPYSEPIQFSGTRLQGETALDAYSHAIDLYDLLAQVPPDRALGNVRGSISQARFSARGVLPHLKIAGSFQVDRLSRLSFAIANSVVTYDLDVARLSAAPQVRGSVILRGGTLTAKQIAVTLHQGQAVFEGDPLSPRFDVRGTSTVESTAIHIAFRGTKEKPELRLTSNPPIPQDALLLMLATGKRWRGTQSALAQGEISTELATDFIDYFVFGGMGNRMARRLGISSLALTHDAASGMVGLQTTIADRVTLGVAMDPGASQSSSNTGTPTSGPLIPYKVGAEYQITEHTSVGIEGQRTLLDARSTSGPSGESAPSGPSPQTDDTVLLKLKKQF